MANAIFTDGINAQQKPKMPKINKALGSCSANTQHMIYHRRRQFEGMPSELMSSLATTMVRMLCQQERQGTAGTSQLLVCTPSLQLWPNCHWQALLRLMRQEAASSEVNHLNLL